MKKIKLIILLVLCIALVNTVKTTYSRYASAVEGSVSINLARWEISVNDEDITSNTSSSLDITPTLDVNSNVAEGKLAPGSTGYFDILIDPTNTDVSFSYTITATPNNTIADLKIKTYDILDDEENIISSGTSYATNITNDVLYDANGYEPFTIRVHFEWVDNVLDETMDDDDDTAIANQVNNGEDLDVTINVNVTFNQYIAPIENQE